MKIEINESERFIKIKDLAKFNYYMLMGILVLVVTNAILNLRNTDENNFDWFAITYLIMGAICFLLLLYNTFKKTAANKINFNKIESLKEKTVFGRKRFSLKLKNGKLRDLYELKSEVEINALKETFNKVGISTKNNK